MNRICDDVSSVVNAFTSYNRYVSGRPVVECEGDKMVVGVGNSGCLISHDLSACFVALDALKRGRWQFRIVPEKKCAYYTLNAAEDGVPCLERIPDMFSWNEKVAISFDTVVETDRKYLSLANNLDGLYVETYAANYIGVEGKSNNNRNNLQLFLRKLCGTFLKSYCLCAYALISLFLVVLLTGYGDEEG